MTNERTTWTDVQRAADRLTDVWQSISGPRPFRPTGNPAALQVTSGSVTNGHAAHLNWAGPNTDNLPVPGGQRLARSARDSYDMLAQRTAVLLDVQALSRTPERADRS